MRRPWQLLTLLALTGLAACAPEGPSAFVTFNVKPDAQCGFGSDSTDSIPTGKYDIWGAGQSISDPDSTNCGRPYFVHLLVNSFLRANSDTALGRAEPNILQLDRAQVTLTDLEKNILIFDGGKQPNPFLVTTNNTLQPASGNGASTGVATVEAIPLAYADFLSDFVNQQILAEIQIYGTTTGDVNIDLKPFVYPIEICDGCLTKCNAELVAAKIDRDDIVNGQCDDNAGADGRYCIDELCTISPK